MVNPMLNYALRAAFLDRFNNYLTDEKYAEHNEIDVETARAIIAIGRKLHEEYCELVNG